MLEHLEILPLDPILGLSATFKQDKNPNKVNLGVGVYKDEQGNTPVFTAITQAEEQLLANQKTKAYIQQAGDPAFLEGMKNLVFGSELAQKNGEKISAVMTPGGSGALRMIGEMIAATNKNPTLWVSTPTWGNHTPLLESAGLTLKKYPYYNKETGLVDFAAMVEKLSQATPGDIVLLHACCHNPSGADLSKTQWQEIIALLEEKHLTPFIDMAYQGFATSLEDDAYGIRLAAEKLPEVLVASSCSKNFGVYRERAGAALLFNQNEEATKAGLSHILSRARRTYSMSAYHGAAAVGVVLEDNDLRKSWETELTEARTRINQARETLAKRLGEVQDKKDFSFIAKNRGMFSFLGLTKEQVHAMRNDSGIYILDSSRINIAGLNTKSIDQVVEAIEAVL